MIRRSKNRVRLVIIAAFFPLIFIIIIFFGPKILNSRESNHKNDNSKRINMFCEGYTSYGGRAICDLQGDQWGPRIVTDGSGGAIIAWRNNAYGYCDLYAQKIDGNLNKVWLPDDICIDYQLSDFKMLSDGTGGAYIVYVEGGPRVVVTKLNSDGTIAWYKAATSSFGSDQPALCLDGSGGVFVAWRDTRNGESEPSLIYANRFDSDGDYMWGDWGIRISQPDEHSQSLPEAFSVYGDCAYIAWIDEHKNDEEQNRENIYTATIDSDADVLQSSLLVGGPYDRCFYPKLALGTYSNDAYVIWEQWDKPNDYTWDIYGQYIDVVSGAKQWKQNNFIVNAGLANEDGVDENYHEIISDGDGGAIVLYRRKSQGEEDIYAMRIRNNWATTWVETIWERPICTAADAQQLPRLVSDGYEGAIITWQDNRSGNFDIYIQQVDASGNDLGPANGLAVCTAPGNQVAERICSDGNHGAIITWMDLRRGNWDVYAQRVKQGLDLPTYPPRCEVIAEIYDYDREMTYALADTSLFLCPQGDGGNILQLTLDFNDADMMAVESVEPEDIVLNVAGLPIIIDGCSSYGTAGDAGNGYTTVVKRIWGSVVTPCETSCDICPPQSIPVYYSGFRMGTVEPLTVKSPDYTGDEYVGVSDLIFLADTYNKHKGDPMYNDCWDFNCDDTVNVSEFTTFGSHYTHSSDLILFQELLAERNFRLILGDKKSGNFDQSKLSITITLECKKDFTAVAAGLDADRSQLEYAGWIPSADFPGSSIVSPVSKHDQDYLFIAIYKREHHMNELMEIGTLLFDVDNCEDVTDFIGEPFLIFGDVLTTGGEIERIVDIQWRREDAPVYIDHLGNGYPNPFNPATSIDYSISRNSHVNLSIYNLQGQVVRTLVNEFKASNEYRVVWDGKDNKGNAVASGVYFCMIKTEYYSQAKKLILLR